MSANSFFSEFLSQNSRVSAENYSRRLWKFSGNRRRVEKPLELAFRRQLKSRGLDVDRLSKELLTIPFLQTAHHLTPCNGPVFNFIDFLCLAAKPAGATYFVATTSGVAFSNRAWSGALNYRRSELSKILKKGRPTYFAAQKSQSERNEQGTKEKRISLIPSSKRDGLLFGAEIPESLLKIVNEFAFSSTLPFPHPKDLADYPSWACEFCQTIQREITGVSEIVYFDLTAVINDYLVCVLKNPAHPVCDLLFGEKGKPNLANAFKNPTLFLMKKPGKKSEKVQPVNFQEIAKKSPDEIIEALEKKEWCGAVFLTFFILAYLNGFRCCGSFLQFNYLRDYLEKFTAIFPEYCPPDSPDSLNQFTGGKMPDSVDYPFDTWLTGQKINTENLRHLPMEFFWKPLGL